MSEQEAVLEPQSIASLRTSGRFTRRQKTFAAIVAAVLLLAGVVAGGLLLGEGGLSTNFAVQNQPPSLSHPFGTDWLGRDMLTRTLRGLTTSVGVGLLAASISALIALLLGTLAATRGGTTDALVGWLVDLFMSVPHIVLIILIAFAIGGGMQGIIIAVALTHWPSLTRVVRAEVLALRESEFIQVARGLGRSSVWVALNHMVPHVLPQFLVGLILLVPHAILHEAGVTFLGFGLSPHKPAVGVILSESMRQLSTGRWWLALLPGLALLVTVRAFDIIGDNVRALLDPRTAHE